MKLTHFSPFSRLLLLFLVAASVVTISSCEDDDGDLEIRQPQFRVTNSEGLIIEVETEVTWYDSSINVASREWVIVTGEGSEITSTEESVTVDYNEVGRFLTTLMVNFQDGTSETRVVGIDVRNKVTPAFEATSTQLTPGGTTQFMNRTTGLAPFVITENRNEMDSSVLFLWVFPGSTTGTDTVEANNPLVTYNELGSFDVSLTVVRRFPRSRETVVLEDYITVTDRPQIAPRTVRFNRDGSALLMHFNQEINLPANNTYGDFVITGDGGATATVTNASIPVWSENNTVVQLDIDGSALTSGSNVTVAYTGTAAGFANGDQLAMFEMDMEYFSGKPAWAPIVYDNGGNIDKVVDIGGMMFQWVTTGAKGSWDNNETINIFNVFPEFLSTQLNGGVEFTVDVTPQGGASLDNLRASGVELFFLNTGSTFTFSHPITDIQYHADPNMDLDLSADGRTLKITSATRGGPPRMTAILENAADIQNFRFMHDQMQDCNLFVTSAPK